MIGMRKVPYMLVVAVVGLTARPAFAAPSYRDTVIGVEIGATNTVGQFVGAATNQLPGGWRITVDHAPLTRRIVAITGGSLHLAALLAGRPVTVSGVFSGGSIAQLVGFKGCTNQSYAVTGTIIHVGVSGGGQAWGAGLFRARLTHYRASFFGHCVTYSASIVGSVALSL